MKLGKKLDVITLTESANKKKVLKQSIDCDELQSTLDDMPTIKELENKLVSEYPVLAWEWLNSDKRGKEALQIVIHNKSFENDPGNFSKYIHGWFHLWLWQE